MPSGYVYSKTFGAVNYGNIRFKLIYYSRAVKMLVACFGVTLPVGKMFEVDLNAHSWFQSRLRGKGGN